MIAGTRGLLALRRDQANNEIGRRILGVSLAADESPCVDRLLEIRGEIRAAVCPIGSAPPGSPRASSPPI